MMNTPTKYCLYPCLLVLLLVACGGGGGGATAPAPVQATASPAPVVSTLNAFRSSGSIPPTFRELTNLPLAPLQDAVQRLPTGGTTPADPIYLKVWFTDPVSDEVSLVALGRYQGTEQLRFQVPLGVQLIQFEVYNVTGSVSGQWSLS